MTPDAKHIEFRDKIVQGLAIAYEKLIEFKKQKNSVLVVMRDNKIVHLNPHNGNIEILDCPYNHQQKIEKD